MLNCSGIHSLTPQIKHGSVIRLCTLTAGEDQRTRVLVHRKVVQLQLALGVDGQPGESNHTKTHIPLSVCWLCMFQGSF